MSGTIELLAVAGIAFAISAGLLTSGLQVLVVRWSRGWAPVSRSRALVLVGIAPLALTLAASVSVVLPSVLALEWPAIDHCAAHDGHAHLCLIHGSDHSAGWVAWALIAGAIVWGATHAARAARAMIRGSTLIRELQRAAVRDTGRDVWVVPTERALCLSSGLLYPRVLVSEGLLADAADDELEVMLAHEGAHGRRRDTLWRLIVRATTLTMLPGARRSLLAALELSSERACDEIAAARVGDRLRVAETLLAMERRLSPADSSLVAAFGPSNVPARVEAMLEPPRLSGAYGPLAAGLLAVVVSLIAGYGEIHHATESMLALLLH